MKRSLRVWMTVVLTVIFGIANAQNTQWFGYARTCFNGESWQNMFVTFSTENPNEVQPVSETLPELWAATYLDGYVWFVTKTRHLCKAPFNEETQTIGSYETVVPALEQYHLIIDMAYNPSDGMMYYICQDSQYNCYLKRSTLDAPIVLETIGSFSLKFWTLAINSQGQAFGVAYEGGNLYEIDLNNATTTLVGPTGKEVWYTQSMAFDLDTDELYWAQFATANDHGLYQVNTVTGEATSLGEIGLGTQLTGLFMVPQPTTPEPELINDIYVEGFTVPAWGEHPDYDIEVSPEAPYTIAHVSWHRYVSNDDHVLNPDEYFDLEDVNYYLSVLLSPREGFAFAENPTVYFDGDPSVFNYGGFSDNDYRIYTIDYQVTKPAGIDEQTSESITVWPNPANDILYLDVKAGETVSIFDMTGRRVMQECYAGQIDVSLLAQGIYAIQAEGLTVRFLKQ